MPISDLILFIVIAAFSMYILHASFINFRAYQKDKHRRNHIDKLENEPAYLRKEEIRERMDELKKELENWKITDVEEENEP